MQTKVKLFQITIVHFLFKKNRNLNFKFHKSSMLILKLFLSSVTINSLDMSYLNVFAEHFKS